MHMTKRHVLLLFGGESSEYDVSIASAHNVYAALDDSTYEVSLGLIDRSGHWWLVDSIEGDHMGCPQLVPVLGQARFVTIPETRVLHPDVILPILHGRQGEDGTVQGLAKLLHIPMVGPSLLSAALTMDKELTKRVLRETGVPVVDWLTWRTWEPAPSYQTVVTQLGSEVFVKPANAGSSVGVSKVHDETEYDAALDEAARHDRKVLIERSIKGREIELAALGNGEARITHPGEIIPGAEFYSYDDKYSATSTSRAVVPADLDDTVVDALRDYAHRAYVATLGQGMARLDFFVTEQGDIYLNEINSIPGFTNISMYPKLWRHEGLSYPALIDRLIALALEPGV